MKKLILLGIALAAAAAAAKKVMDARHEQAVWAEVTDSVWDLLDFTYRQIGVHPTLLERDFNIPPLETLVSEVARIESLQRRHNSRNGAATGRNNVSNAINS